MRTLPAATLSDCVHDALNLTRPGTDLHFSERSTIPVKQFLDASETGQTVTLSEQCVASKLCRVGRKQLPLPPLAAQRVQRPHAI